MQGLGGNIGPDLTTVGKRFTRGDLITAIVHPSDAVSDQYASTVITKNDGTQVMGRIVTREAGRVSVNVNPFDPSVVVGLDEAEIAHEAVSRISPMPARLIDRLNEREMLDLLVFVLAGGDAAHELYHPEATSASE
jgi:putative heme-binding domain-containing protein